MLVTRHHDRPGTMGRIGQVLGDADVNISAMSLARTTPRADALMILALDDEPSPEVVAAIRGQEAVLDVWAIRLRPERDGMSGDPGEDAGEGRAARAIGS